MRVWHSVSVQLALKLLISGRLDWVKRTYGVVGEPAQEQDVLFFVPWRSESAKKVLEKLQKKPFWQQLKAVQQNQVYFVDSSHWYDGDIFAINAIIDDLFKYLVNTP